MLNETVRLRHEVDTLRERAQQLPQDDKVDPQWVMRQVRAINTLPEDTIACFKSHIDVWTGDEVVQMLHDDISDLSMQRPRDRHGMNVDHRHIARVQRQMNQVGNGLLFTGDDVYTLDSRPLTNQEFAMLLEAQSDLLGTE